MTPAQERHGRLLVALQFGLIALLAADAAPAFVSGRASPAAWLLAGAGVAVGVAAVAANRPGNFNIRPTPHPQGVLVEHGVYRWIRHPMYSAVMLLALAATLAHTSALTVGSLVALALVLNGKATLEERAMAGRHAGYAGYAARTKRFVPGLY